MTISDYGIGKLLELKRPLIIRVDRNCFKDQPKSVDGLYEPGKLFHNIYVRIPVVSPKIILHEAIHAKQCEILGFHLFKKIAIKLKGCEFDWNPIEFHAHNFGEYIWNQAKKEICKNPDQWDQMEKLKLMGK